MYLRSLATNLANKYQGMYMEKLIPYLGLSPSLNHGLLALYFLLWAFLFVEVKQKSPCLVFWGASFFPQGCHGHKNKRAIVSHQQIGGCLSAQIDPTNIHTHRYLSIQSLYYVCTKNKNLKKEKSLDWKIWLNVLSLY